MQDNIILCLTSVITLKLSPTFPFTSHDNNNINVSHPPHSLMPDRHTGSTYDKVSLPPPLLYRAEATLSQATVHVGSTVGGLPISFRSTIAVRRNMCGLRRISGMPSASTCAGNGAMLCLTLLLAEGIGQALEQSPQDVFYRCSVLLWSLLCVCVVV